ncbi:MAG: DUF6446 family protein [Pseudomonadota bacterium]
MGKLVVILLGLSALAAGAGLWYTATRAFYAPMDGPVTLTLSDGDALTAIPATGIEAIASTASPLGFRACFAHDLDLAALGPVIAVEPRPDAAPTIAPDWFDCYDAGALGAALAAGEAVAFTAYENARYGVDRIVALAPDGRGWAWHQLNDCGDKAYDGTPVGEACPDRATYRPLTEGSL